jgi:hypothetical protein
MKQTKAAPEPIITVKPTQESGSISIRIPIQIYVKDGDRRGYREIKGSAIRFSADKGANMDLIVRKIQSAVRHLGSNYDA